MENNITDHKHEIWCLNRLFEDNSIQKDIEVKVTEDEPDVKVEYIVLVGN